MKLLLAILVAIFSCSPAAAESIWFKVELSDSQHGHKAETFYLKREQNKQGWGPWQRYVKTERGLVHGYNFTAQSGGRSEFDQRVASYLDKNVIASGKWQSFVQQSPVMVTTPTPVGDTQPLVPPFSPPIAAGHGQCGPSGCDTGNMFGGGGFASPRMSRSSSSGGS